MGKLTFKDVVGKEFTLYEVSRGGAIYAHVMNSYVWESSHYKNIDLNSSTLHINENGNIGFGWGCAYLLNADEAAELATRIVTTKYNNSIKKIKEVTNT